MANFALYDDEPAFNAKDAAYLIVGADDTDAEKRDIAQVLRKLEQAYARALEHYDIVGKSDAVDKWISPNRPKWKPTAIRSVRMKSCENVLPVDPTGGTMGVLFEREFRQFVAETFDRAELQRWLGAMAMQSAYRFSDNRVQSEGERGAGRAQPEPRTVAVLPPIEWEAVPLPESYQPRSLPVADAPPELKAAPTDDWVEMARTRAWEIVKDRRARDLYPNQPDIADIIAEEFRKQGTTGSMGKPLSGAYIKRHALKGISSAVSKRLSTTTRQSK